MFYYDVYKILCTYLEHRIYSEHWMIMDHHSGDILKICSKFFQVGPFYVLWKCSHFVRGAPLKFFGGPYAYVYVLMNKHVNYVSGPQKIV